MEFLSNYLQFRATCVKNLICEIFSERSKYSSRCSHKPTSQDKKACKNVKCMLVAINLLHENTLKNFITNQVATPQQRHDLLHFRKIGEASFTSYVHTKLLKIPSADAPVRRKRLCTFTVTQAEKRLVKLADKEDKLAQRYMRKMLNWVSEKRADTDDLKSLLGPILPIPRAIVGCNGLTYKGTKSHSTACFKKRYHNPTVVTETLPTGWTPDDVILEGMFLIHTRPLASSSSMQDYVKLLLRRFIKPHFQSGVHELHLVFDNPGGQQENPKELEWERRDNNKPTHFCESFSEDLMIPEAWTAVISCRACKKALTVFIAEQLLRLAPHTICGVQSLTTNAGNTVY